MYFYATDLCANIYTLHILLGVIKSFDSLKALHKFPIIIKMSQDWPLAKKQYVHIYVHRPCHY